MAKRETRCWRGKVQACGLCTNGITKEFIDGKTVYGSWGIMCLSCHDAYGYGLGVGKGQRYVLVGDKFVKKEDKQ